MTKAEFALVKELDDAHMEVGEIMDEQGAAYVRDACVRLTIIRKKLGLTTEDFEHDKV